MNLIRSLFKDLSHAAVWYLLILAIALFSGGAELTYIYAQF
jgi:hypothetical protein